MRAAEVTATLRPARAEVDLGAIRHNASVLARTCAPGRLCAVVKAGGYGHGAAQAASAALEGGASWLAVALVEEGLELRRAGIGAPVLLLSEPPPAAMAEAVAAELTPTLYTAAGLDAVASAARSAGRGPFPVHVKADTGMHRVGAPPAEAVALALGVAASPELELQGFWTHLAVADELSDPRTGAQMRAFEEAVASLAASGVRPPLLHAANSAGALWHRRGPCNLVRCGITLYGLAPSAALCDREPMGLLRPAMSLSASVSHVKRLAAGERLSYGLRYRLEADSVVATVPLGYADGVPRRLSAVGGEVLLGGRRRPIAGTVTMDQILVDCGPGADVAPGDEVVLVGRQGGEEVGAWEWAVLLDTIAYEVLCGISSRVPRRYRDGSRGT